MLATESARGLYGRKKMPSLHPRGRVNGSFKTLSPQPYIPDLNGGSQGLFPVSVTSAGQPPNGVQRDDNIMNRKADMNSSLYQTCLGLKMRLAQVPGFSKHIAEMEAENVTAKDSTDPVASMWDCFRRGYPLMTIYNALNPVVPLKVDESKLGEAKIGKAATFKFLQACLTDLRFPSNECFLITDLYGVDTTGFVKVIKVVNRVLDLLSQRGLLLHTEKKSAHSDDDQKPHNRTYRQNVVNELVTTERNYVQHLETLQQFRNEIEESGAIVGDAVHHIFLNLNALLDFQRRFLIRIEQQNSLPEDQQNWGELFLNHKESFRVYEPFIANQIRCNAVLMKEWDKMKTAPLSPAVIGLLNTPHILAGFLLKPFQRISKYPMLLMDLRLKGALDEKQKLDLFAGECAARAVLNQANESLDKEHRRTAMNELNSRIEDWKNIKMESLGDLLLDGTFDVIKTENGKESPREFCTASSILNSEALAVLKKVNHPLRGLCQDDTEAEWMNKGENNGEKTLANRLGFNIPAQFKVYLFETFLLCCKEPKNKMLGTNKPGKLRLHLKGRISLNFVTDVITFANSDKPTYSLQIFWKGDSGVESFKIRFPNEDLMQKWRDAVATQQHILVQEAKRAGQGTSETEFTSLKNQKIPLENPYLQDEEIDEDDSQGSTLVDGHHDIATTSRNASTSSLRAAATLAGSSMLPSDRSTSRMAQRYPQTDYANNSYSQPLTLHTNLSAKVESPVEFAGNSYFSPTESPMSTRSSAQSYNYFPRQATPSSTWSSEDSKHKTAPATSRAPSRDGTGSPNTFIISGRAVQRPSLPAMAPSQTSQQISPAQSRLRSVSTPDIHNSSGPAPRRYVNGQLQPSIDSNPVPPLPSHVVQMRAPVNRSQANSPINAQLPIRGTTQSPQLQRDSHAQLQRDSHAQLQRDSHAQLQRESRAQQQRHQQQVEAQRHQQQADTAYRVNNQHGNQQQNAHPSSNSGAHQMMRPPPVQVTPVIDNAIPYPTQLKVKIWFEPAPSHVTIVVPIIIKHRSLIDRIDSKMVRISSASISNGTARLRYRDQDGDILTVASDEDVSLAIEDWALSHLQQLQEGIVSDFELFWHEN